MEGDNSFQNGRPDMTDSSRNSRRLLSGELHHAHLHRVLPSSAYSTAHIQLPQSGAHWCTLSANFIMKRQRDPPSTGIVLVDDDDEDEFEPLFSYSKTVGPAPTFLSDDSDEEEVIITSAPRRWPEIMPSKEHPTPTPQRAPAKSVILDDDDDDDDSWLMPSPPKLPKMPQTASSTGNLAILQLRQKRRELMMLQEASSPGAIRRVEERARMQAQQRVEAESSPLVLNTPERLESQVEPPKSEARVSNEKEKVMIKVQNKSGSSQSIRIYTTDKFEKLFTVYAKMVEASVSSLSFRFDGDQLSPDSTPKEHEMEDGDIIEVYTKR